MSENLSSFLGNAESIPKRVMPIFFLIDTSGSMEGKKIGAVNSAIEELIPDLRHLSESQADSEIKLSVLKFSTGCEWVTPALMSLDAFDDWEPLDANGLTDLGAAFLELNDKLSKNGFMDRGAASSGFYAPVILLLSDGEPTDDYLTALKKLQQNKWYQAALKIAIAIGEDANREVLKKAIRNVELLFTVNDIGSLKKIIRFLTDRKHLCNGFRGFCGSTGRCEGRPFYVCGTSDGGSRKGYAGRRKGICIQQYRKHRRIARTDDTGFG